ncbi:serine/threonine-protein phosphatase [Pseudidiomarina marina]|uniref:SpoIIE family protein phosphatase n=1 Tax=Pseudidiomarina marina TaxID=502366 RepID=UPI00384C05DF
MSSFYESAAQSMHVYVIDDGSDLARDVNAQLRSYQLFAVSTCSIEQVATLSAPNEKVLYLVVAGEKAQVAQISALLQSSSTQSILITDSPIVFQQLGQFATDALLWPLASNLLQQRLNYLHQLQVAHDQLDGLKQSLAWHKARVDREHQLVEHIFQNALSRNYLEYAHVHTYLTPVSKFNGDLCLIAPGPLGNIYMLMADFTGHGLAPATGALPLSQAFFAMSDRGVSVAEMVTEFNYRMSRLLPDDMFCAAILLELSANGERVTYWNGGMPAALLFDEQGEILKRLSPAHMALGVVDDDEFDSRVATFRAPKGSSIALFTDGVTELLGHQHKFLGSEALEMLLSKYPRTEDFTSLVDELERFRGETPLHDDLSLAILSCRPTGLGEVKVEPEQFGLPFVFESVLHPEHLTTVDPVAHILSALSQLPHLRRHRTTIYLFLAEAFNNALEHGLLALDSAMKQDPEGFAEYYQLRLERLHALQRGEIRIRVHFEPNSKELTVSVSDNGSGAAEISTSPNFTEKSHGRGLELLRQMTTDLHWDSETRTVSFKYVL